MAMNIESQRVLDLAREAATRTNTTQEQTVEAALEQYLLSLDPDDAQAAVDAKVARVRAIVHQLQADIIDEDRAAMRAALDGLYDEDGLPV